MIVTSLLVYRVRTCPDNCHLHFQIVLKKGYMYQIRFFCRARVGTWCFNSKMATIESQSHTPSDEPHET